MDPSGGLPGVNTVGLGAPFRWLSGAWSDLWKAWPPCLAYGLALAVGSAWFSWVFIASNAAFWVLALTCGFVFVAPMLAMGLYEAGRVIEAGGKPTLRGMVLLPQAFRQDVAYLGLALLVIYFFWGRIAQVVYGLTSTFTMQHTVREFVEFAFFTPGGHTMLIVGSIVGGAIAFFTYCLVVISAPMLLDQRASVFAATVTSFRVVSANFVPMLLWAVIISVLTLSTAFTGFAAMIVIFPWLGLASWRAYRDLVAEPVAAAA